MPSYIFVPLVIVLALIASYIAIVPVVQSYRLRALTSIFFAFCISLLYFKLGGSLTYYAFKDKQEQQFQVQELLKHARGRDKIIGAMLEQLKANPNEAKGWYLLGRLYAGEGNWLSACDAFGKAVDLDNQNDAYQVNYAQSQWQLNQQVFNDVIRSIFKAVLLRNPQQPDSLAMLAMDQYQNKNYLVAIQLWERLLAQLPNDSEDAYAVQKAIAKAQRLVDTELLGESLRD